MMAEKVTIGNCELWHGDCCGVLPLLPPVDLVLTDPPYGIGADENPVRGKWGMGVVDNAVAWDRKRPERDEIALVVGAGRDAILWGGNYFADFLPPSQGWLVWDKITRNFSLADCELAWSTFDRASRVLSKPRTPDFDKSHPTQKPLYLMEWCLSMVPKAKSVLDAYMGSGTTGVACARMGLQFVGIERERKYFDIACRRIEQAYAQPRLFEDAKVGAGDTAVQGDMLLPANAELSGPDRRE